MVLLIILFFCLFESKCNIFLLILFLLKTLLKDKPLKQPLEFRLQNSRCFSVAEESHVHEAREPHTPVPSLALRFSASVQNFCLTACAY